MMQIRIDVRIMPISVNSWRPDVLHAVHISTPDHWHVPISLTAARACKDMYMENPLGISIEQCLAAREILEKYKIVNVHIYFAFYFSN
ncbi:MAG: hypothetical protein U5R06_11010 [candidate division KSB1 bacterium]|nr:hypothetical protein [candidate division KSB1 bacterium]